MHDRYISQAALEQWLDHGFLVVCQGLLSVTGHEKSMLEDTLTAVDALNKYQIRLSVHSSGKGISLNPTDNTNSSHNPNATDLHSYSSDIKLDELEMLKNPLATPIISINQNNNNNTPNNATNTNTNSNTNTSTSEPIEPVFVAPPEDTSRPPVGTEGNLTYVLIRGRQVTLYLQENSLQKLPEIIQNKVRSKEGAVIQLVAVLFSQVNYINEIILDYIIYIMY